MEEPLIDACIGLGCLVPELLELVVQRVLKEQECQRHDRLSISAGLPPR